MRFYTVEDLGPKQAMTPEGFLVARDVPIARTGVQRYHATELPIIDAGDDGWIDVDRDPSEVFASRSIASFEGKPIVNNHPADGRVTPDTWRELAIGHVSNVRRKGDVLLADLLFTTPDGIKAVRNGKRGISVGYDAEYVSLGPGCARQRNIEANHVALVDEARCGPTCSIGDRAPKRPTFDATAWRRHDAARSGVLLARINRDNSQFWARR